MVLTSWFRIERFNYGVTNYGGPYTFPDGRLWPVGVTTPLPAADSNNSDERPMGIAQNQQT